MNALIVWLEANSLGLTQWLLNYWLHSSLFVLLALSALKLGFIKADAKGEFILKAALVLGLVSSSLSLYKSDGDFMVWQWQAQPRIVQDIATQSSGLNTEVASQDADPTGMLQSRPNDAASVATTGSATGSSTGSATEPAPASAVPLASTSNSDRKPLSNIVFWLVVYWLLGLAIMVLLRIYQYLQLSRLVRSRTQVTDDPLVDALHRIKAQAGIKHPIVLFQSESICSPFALNQREIVIPANLMQEYSMDQKQAALAHEIAHLKRGDMRWQWISVVIETLFYIQPLNRILKKETVQLVEQRTDLLAAEWTGKPRALAEALSVAAKINLQQQNFELRHTQWVMAMKSEKSNLMKRVEQLLANPSRNTKKVSVYLLSALSLFLLLSAPSLSLVQGGGVAATSGSLEDHISEPSSGGKGTSHYSTSSDHQDAMGGEGVHSFSHIEDDDGVNRIKLTTQNDQRTLRINATLNGTMGFNREETQIQFFPADSKIDIRYSNDIEKKRLIISRGNGDIEYQFYENQQELGAEQGKAWFAKMIPEILRITGWHARTRVERIYSDQGVTGVLQEVKHIRSDHVSSVYLDALVQQGQMDYSELQGTIAAMHRLNSDYQMGKVMANLVNSQEIPDSIWVPLLEASHELQSDVEQAKFLQLALVEMPEDPEVVEAFVQASQKVESDYQLASLLGNLVRAPHLSGQAQQSLLQAANTIESDYELASLLIDISRSLPLEDNAEPFLLLVATIESDYEMRRVFAEVLRQRLDQRSLTMLLELAAQELHSDHDMAKTLVMVLRTQAGHLDIENLVKEAATTIHSKHEHSVVMQELQKLG